MNLDDLIEHPPLLHANRVGDLTSWGASMKLLRYLDSKLQEGMTTLETGAGLSTILFALNGCNHTSVVPDATQMDRILDWCEENEVITDRLKFIIDGSERALPKYVFSSPIDLYLIDGGHGFPTPFIDWFYVANNIKVGGLIVVDDVQIWTGRVLRQFLAEEPDWAIDHSESMEFFGARRTGITEAVEWHEQPYVTRRSMTPGSTSLSRRAIGYAFLGYRFGSSALPLVRERDWPELRRRLEIVKRNGGLDGKRTR